MAACRRRPQQLAVGAVRRDNGREQVRDGAKLTLPAERMFTRS